MFRLERIIQSIYSTNPKHAMDLLEEKDEAKDTYNTCSYWDK